MTVGFWRYTGVCDFMTRLRGCAIILVSIGSPLLPLVVSNSPVIAAAPQDSAVIVKKDPIPMFHIAIGPDARVDCLDNTISYSQPLLRCDRYVGGTQETTLRIFKGAARYVAHPGDSVGDPVGRLLSSGEAFKRNPFTCVAHSSSVDCHDGNTGHGFVLRKSSYRIY